MNLMMLLEMASTGFGERVAIQNGPDKITFSELFDAASAAGAGIKARGVEHVTMLDISSIAFPVALFGSAWAGVPFVPLNYRLTGDELDALVARVAPSVLLADPERFSSLHHLADTQVESRTDFLHAARDANTAKLEDEWSTDAEDIAILLFTSGTTGAPKAAVLRHKHIVSYILSSVEFMGAAEEDALLVCVPPYHIAGIAQIASSVYSGRRIVQLPNFTAEDWIETARREKVTNAMVVPTMLARIIDVLEDEDSANLPDLRAISYGGGKMPQPIIEQAMKLFPDTNFTNAYGLTETSSTVSVLTPEDHRDAIASDDPAIRKRLTSVGQPYPTLELEIRDDEGKVCATGERGEIYVRGEQVSGEYVGKGSVLLDDGFFPTRDGGYLDEGGYLFLEGRVDDIIVRGGENISPGEIEDVMLEHAAVADVAVVGIPDEQWGEAVVAAVVLKNGKDASVSELQQFVKEHLRSSRTPERIDFKSELPYNETGKLLRRSVRADFTE
jgi:acyl-CoA synthetase (AMP-forming)/AMP-acid ligase II